MSSQVSDVLPNYFELITLYSVKYMFNTVTNLVCVSSSRTNQISVEYCV